MSDEQHGMKGWGRVLGADLDAPRNRDDAALTCLMSLNDRLVEILTVLQDLQIRVARMEVFLEETIPAYSQTSTYRQYPPSPQGEPFKRLPTLAGG